MKESHTSITYHLFDAMNKTDRKDRVITHFKVNEEKVENQLSTQQYIFDNL